MKIILSFFTTISMAAAASQAGSYIRGSSASSVSDDVVAATAAAHMVPDDIFAGLENANNNWRPQEYCPRNTKYNKNGPQWPPEVGCYPGTPQYRSGYPKCCDKGNCPSNSRPLCENRMAGAADYCANMAPNPDCYVGGWPECCLTDGKSCPPNPPSCNVNQITYCYSSSQCRSREYCSKQPLNCNDLGKCVEKPKFCNKIDDPVCGCDGKTYTNECVAAAFGRTNVEYYGKCGGNDKRICNWNSECGSDEYCDFPDGDCGYTSSGECKSIPSGQDCNGVKNDKVCGCDNREYKNACKANQKGQTSIQRIGRCFAGLAFE